MGGTRSTTFDAIPNPTTRIGFLSAFGPDGIGLA
jgi:hypothetical protein